MEVRSSGAGGGGRFIAGEAPVWQPRADRQASPHNRDGTSDPYKTFEQQQQRSAVSGSIGILLNKLLFTESANYADSTATGSLQSPSQTTPTATGSSLFTESNYAKDHRVSSVTESNYPNGHRV